MFFYPITWGKESKWLKRTKNDHFSYKPVLDLSINFKKRILAAKNTEIWALLKHLSFPLCLFWSQSIMITIGHSIIKHTLMFFYEIQYDLHVELPTILRKQINWQKYLKPTIFYMDMFFLFSFCFYCTYFHKSKIWKPRFVL